MDERFRVVESDLYHPKNCFSLCLSRYLHEKCFLAETTIVSLTINGSPPKISTIAVVSVVTDRFLVSDRVKRRKERREGEKLTSNSFRSFVTPIQLFRFAFEREIEKIEKIVNTKFVHKESGSKDKP